MLLSQTAHYALRAVYYLATCGESKWHLTKDVADATKIPAPYLARILSSLAKRGILKSRTGMGGGFSIGEECNQYNLYDVVSHFDNLDNIKDCVFGFTNCCDEGQCSLHKAWNDAKERLIDALKSTSLKDMKTSFQDFDWSRVSG